MFQVPEAKQMDARKRLSGLQCTDTVTCHVMYNYTLDHGSEAQRFLHRHLLTCVLPMEARVAKPRGNSLS